MSLWVVNFSFYKYIYLYNMDMKKQMLNELLVSSKKEVNEVIEMLEKYFFYDFLYYMVISITSEVNDWKPIADSPVWIIEYAISLVLSIEDYWEERAWEEECIIFMEKIKGLWMKAWIWSMLMWNDEFVSHVSSNFLTVRWHDYDEHLQDYLKGLFLDFNDYFKKKLWFTVENLIELYESSKLVNKEFPFVLNPVDEKSHKAINFVSSLIWDNKSFLEWKYWWLFWWSKSIVPSKSIIKFKDNYFIFEPLLILQNIKENLETVLKDDKTVWNKYERNRAKLLEDKSVEYILKMLSWAKWYVNLKYDGDKETDWLVLYDNNIFIIEAKAWVLRKPSTKWNQKMLEEDIEKLMVKWYEQALRTKNYIENNRKTVFNYGEWKTITVENDKVNKIYLINTTWDYLWLISLKLDVQRNKWKIADNIHFWSIYINDLRVISELIEFPTQFLLFLDRRHRLIDFPQIIFQDELDIFMDFMNWGLFFEDWKVYWESIKWFDTISMDTTTTNIIDRYYWWVGDKPTMKINNQYREIINDIESINKRWFSEISTFLLSINQNDTLSILDKLKKEFLKDWKEHSFTCLFKDISVFDFILLYRKWTKFNREHYLKYSKSKLEQTWMNKWYNIYFSIDLNWKIKVEDFDIVILVEGDKTEEHKFRVQMLRNRVFWKQINLKTGKKLYRKSPCPCWSWKKFKRCCWSKYYD